MAESPPQGDPIVQEDIDDAIATHEAMATVHQDAPALVAAHAGDDDAHHAKYTNNEAVTAMGAKADDNPLNHDQADEWGAGEHAAVGDGNPHHAPYEDTNAVAAMGAKSDGNPLHHDRPSILGQGARARRTSGQSIPNGIITVITFDTEDFDNDDMWEGVTNPERLTINTAGIYIIKAEIHWVDSVSGTYRVSYINHSVDAIICQELFRVTGGGNLRLFVSPVTIHYCAAGTFLTLSVYQNTGEALNANADGNQSTVLSAVRIG